MKQTLEEYRKYKISVISILLVNSFPVFGVFILDWNAALIILLYWAENVVIGFYNILKMITARGKSSSAKFEINGNSSKKVTKKNLIPFFMVHYGMFTGIHGVFVFFFFGIKIEYFKWILLPFLMLFISHGISFALDFIRRGEYRRVSFQTLFMQPYPRILVLHITIIFGGFIANLLQSPPFALLILVIIKTILDTILYLKERKKSFSTEVTDESD